MEWRYFDTVRDQDAAAQLWHDIGWLNKDNPRALEGMKAYTASGIGYVAEVHSHPACFVFESESELRYQHGDLPLSVITGVATDRSGRKQGLAKALTAKALAEAGARGMAVAGLSTFEQGFYDRLGFGIGPYEHIWRFDPARLTVDSDVRPPHHLTLEHAEALHQARLGRRKCHGTVTLKSPELTRSSMLRSANGFGLGYFDDGDETPSHGLWCTVREAAWGPYAIEFMAWKTREQFLELLGLIKQWGDQVRLVCLLEPPGVQLQDFMDRPTQHFISTEGSNFHSGCRAHACFQYRILDLAACIGAFSTDGPALEFNLELHDPMSDEPVDTSGRYSEPPWTGLSGNYRLSLGKTSHIEPGADEQLPTLRADVGAFSRLWLGVRPATGLSITDALSGPDELLAALDQAFRLPIPVTDCQF